MQTWPTGKPFSIVIRLPPINRQKAQLPLMTVTLIALRLPVSQPLISALIDTFNQERYIEHAILSVLDQGLSPSELEIIVVDDGSTDGTGAIVQQFLPRIRYLRKENGGPASALNSAIPELRDRKSTRLNSSHT